MNEEERVIVTSAVQDLNRLVEQLPPAGRSRFDGVDDVKHILMTAILIASVAREVILNAEGKA